MCVSVLEGHTGDVLAVRFSPGGTVLASRSQDGTVRLWRVDTGEQVASLPCTRSPGYTSSGLAVHLREPILAALGEDEKVIFVWRLDYDLLLGAQPLVPSVHYANAKVVLVGDTGVGKSGLGLVLSGRPYQPTDSTHGRHVWTFESREVELPGKRNQTLETLLWDLAGQPAYRVIHQLHLREVAVALVVFDARSETDPLAGVRHWDRALRLAHQREGSGALPMRKFLVAARTDRGGVSISKARIERVKEEFGFDGYFETSAQEGWQIADLTSAIRQAIAWEGLPVVTSSGLFAAIRAFILGLKESGRLLATVSDLYHDFIRDQPQAAAEHDDLYAEFDTCIGRLENRDLIRRLSFGGYVLLQPELLDAYASSMVNAAKNEPDGLGSITEEAALAGRFYVPKEQRISDETAERLLLHGTVEELVRHDVALWETAEDGRYLVFPSQFNRDYEDAPEPQGRALEATFEGPVQSIYSTLAVRLSHSGRFDTTRTEMWRNAVVYAARAGGKCGLILREFAEAWGELAVFYDAEATDETRFHFEEYILAHLNRRALGGSVQVHRLFVCPKCNNPVPEVYVKLLRDQGSDRFDCPCGQAVSLAEPREKLAKRYPSQVEAMDRSADREREFSAFVVSAGGETKTPSFIEWAGDEHATLAIVFTDVVDSTPLAQELRLERMSEVRRAHFGQGHRLLVRHRGREIKTFGDSFMAAFHNAGLALDFALAFQRDTGHERVRIRAGIHVGLLQVDGEDAFGGTVTLAARVAGKIKRAEIWLSEQAKAHIDELGARRHGGLKWKKHAGVALKGLPGRFTLWSLVPPPSEGTAGAK